MRIDCHFRNTSAWVDAPTGDPDQDHDDVHQDAACCRSQLLCDTGFLQYVAEEEHSQEGQGGGRDKGGDEESEYRENKFFQFLRRNGEVSSG